jgi:hypothetical protein
MVFVHIHFLYGLVMGLMIGLFYIIMLHEKWRKAYNALLRKYLDKIEP